MPLRINLQPHPPPDPADCELHTTPCWPSEPATLNPCCRPHATTLCTCPTPAPPHP